MIVAGKMSLKFSGRPSTTDIVKLAAGRDIVVIIVDILPNWVLYCLYASNVYLYWVSGAS